MILGNPYSFSVFINTIKEWNIDNEFCNGILLFCVDGDFFPKRIVTATLKCEIQPMNYPAASCGVSKVATSTYNPICYTALFSLRFYRLFYNFFPVPVLSHIYL